MFCKGRRNRGIWVHSKVWHQTDNNNGNQHVQGTANWQCCSYSQWQISLWIFHLLEVNMKELGFSPVPMIQQIRGQNLLGNRTFPYLLSSASNWIEAYVGKENSCWPSKHSIHPIREKSGKEKKKRKSKCRAVLACLTKKIKAPDSFALPASDLITNPSCLEANVTTSYNNK